MLSTAKLRGLVTASGCTLLHSPAPTANQPTHLAPVHRPSRMTSVSTLMVPLRRIDVLRKSPFGSPTGSTLPGYQPIVALALVVMVGSSQGKSLSSASNWNEPLAVL